MIIVTCLYITVAFFGYMKYGENVAGSITLNLPVNEWWVNICFHEFFKINLQHFDFTKFISHFFFTRLAQLIIIAFTLAIFFSYGLQFYVPINDILLPEVHSRYVIFCFNLFFTCNWMFNLTIFFVKFQDFSRSPFVCWILSEIWIGLVYM